MQWILIVVGLSLLAVGALLTWLLMHRNAATYTRLSLPNGLLSLVRKTAQLAEDRQDVTALANAALGLMEHLHQLRLQLRKLPPLPESPDGEPRLIELAREVADTNQFSPAALIEALDAWPQTATPSEIQAFPACIAVAQCQQLRVILRSMQADAKIRQRAKRLARSLQRSKQPYALLDKAGLNSSGLAALAEALRHQEQSEALVLLDRWLEVHELTADDLVQQDTLHQVQIAEELRRTMNCFAALEQLPWIECCEAADALHPLLLKDPAGIYPAMTAKSRLQLRLEVEMLSHHVHLDATEIIRHALLLCEDAEPRALEQYVGYWLQDATGLRTLYRSLPTRKGDLYVRFSRRQPLLRYLLRLCLGILFGFGFLHSGEPVFMLPFFLLVMRSAIRQVSRRLDDPPLPQMDLAKHDRPLKTLVVLPAVLHDQHEAIRMVRQLRTVSHNCPAEGTEYILLGDFAPNMTAVSSSDGMIMQAAVTAVTALQSELPIHYLQRGRTWDADRHIYCARGGRIAAISELCRLNVQGECADTLACATLEVATLERKYDFIFVLSPQQHVLPGMLRTALEKMLHPLCSRYPTGDGWRGISILSTWAQPTFQGAGLILPGSFLEATDSILPLTQAAEILSGELAGYASTGHCADDLPSPVAWEEQYAAAKAAWKLLTWQLPWVRTPSGILTNPLSQISRLRLRDLLRDALLPLGQLTLLLWAVLTQNWLLLLIAFLLPEGYRVSLHRKYFMQLGARVALLPMRALTAVLPLWFALPGHRNKSPQWPTLEIWAQGISATVFAAFGLAIPSFALPALLLSVLFACFPVAHQIIDGPTHKEEGLTQDHLAMLESAATSTWQYFTAQANPLPPCAVQYEPAHTTDSLTSPEAIGAYLLSCVCAKELELITATAAAQRIQQVLAVLRDLPMPAELPCQRYSPPSLTVADPTVSAASVGFFAAALMTVAQALRTWLPELPPQYTQLSAEATNLLAALDFAALYNPESGLFYAALDEDQQPTGAITRFADQALLLLITAAAQKQVPSTCLQKLRQTYANCARQIVPLSAHGAASEHLLAGLFLPLADEDAAAFIQAMATQGKDGLWGQDACYTRHFDRHLRYLYEAHGLQQAAAHPASLFPVFTPFAAALALPFCPRQAADALARFCALGANGPMGFCDAVDCSDTPVLIGTQDSYHQGLILCTIAHILADAPLRRYFCALPEVEALLPQLQHRASTLMLPALPQRKHTTSPDTSTSSMIVDPHLHPTPMHLLGTADFRLLAASHGMAQSFDHNTPLTKEHRFYLADEGRVYPLGNPALPIECHFNPGELHLEQLCGSLRSEFVICADTLRRRVLHIITVTNLSTRDRTIELTDCLLPAFAPANTLEPSMPSADHLCLHARGTGVTLHHQLAASIPLLRTTVCTDASAFAGRTGSMLQPASLNVPAEALLIPTINPCLSFRTRVPLGGRGQVTLWFTTSLLENAPPQFTELDGIRQLCALQYVATQKAAGLTEPQLRTALRLLPFLLQGHGLPQEATSALSDLPAILGWLKLHGIPAETAPSPLCLDTSLSLDAQLDAMYTVHTTPSSTAKEPIPALLPRQELLLSGTYGGFDPGTLDYILQLEPGQLPPLPWTNRHITRYFQDTTDETGLKSPFHEQLRIEMQDGTVLSPWSLELPRAVRFRPGETDWEAWSDQLDLRLRAACLPGHRCALRSLHIHNASDATLTLQITVSAHLGKPLVCTGDTIMTDVPDQRLQAFLAGPWQISSAVPDDPTGQTALLSSTVILAPGRSSRIFWLAGYTRHGEDAVRALAAAQTSTTSDLLREAHLPWAKRLGTFSISTPENTLDVLMNRVLPWQALCAADCNGVPALKYIDIASARRALLHKARQDMHHESWAQFILTLADYIRVTQDFALLDVYLPHHGDSLLNVCQTQLLSVPLDQHHLPLGDDQARLCFLFALAAQALDTLRAAPACLDFSRTLLNAADTYLWQEGYYGTPLRLDVQSLACAAYGANPRTRQALTTCWTTLYEQRHGLIRLQEASDIPPLPGLPENGGMVTLEAVRYLRVLLKAARHEEAFELLRALNPLHHTDTPQRQETFLAAPFQLHGGMYASPMEAGRATPGGDEAAAFLYAIVLEDILGFHRRGNTLQLHPYVPADWEAFTITLQEGASTWHISAERRIKTLTVDGKACPDSTLQLMDDGNIHHVHFPLT